METLVQTYRLDAQEQQIKQLQGDVAKIKTSLKLLEEELVESREFRKVVLNWMHHQDSRSNSRSISQFPDSSSGSVSPPSFSAQLEAFIARSEARLGKSLLHTGCGSKSRPESINWALSTAENTFVPDRFEEASADRGHLLRNIHSDSSFSGGSADPLFRSPSLPSSPSLCIQLKNIMSKSGENSLGDGLLMSHRVNGLLLDNLQGMLGSEPLVGHDVELKTVVDLDYPDLGQSVEQTMVVGLIFSDLDLCERGKAPFDRGKNSLSHRPLIGTRLTFSATWNLWVVHGQPRPPDVAANPSLEDKTVLKGGVMMGISYEGILKGLKCNMGGSISNRE
ncbi:uncharacterized protein LOC110886979 [Helianthus annuus]|uniref:uncharacterized protein LOC110886979 n=1 Tax=Helianthus annuus TaxID=4232 RepID=UPI000B8FA4F6|nr:uncharacterized protein LOC110886979 [Helianthus annuus]